MASRVNHIPLSAHYVPVSDPEEIAFALCLFVEFVEGRLTPTQSRSRNGLSSDCVRSESDPVWVSPAERALAAIWEFYGEDPRRGDICARLAAFYLLMSTTDGAAFAEWIVESPDQPGETALSSELIQAIATAPLSKYMPYDEKSFLAFLRQTAPVEACVL